MHNSPQHSRTQYDIRSRRPVPPQSLEQQIRVLKDNVAETGPADNPAEPFVDLLDTNGFKAMVMLIILPAVKNLRAELLSNVNMAEGQRQRCLASLATFESLLTKVYEKAGQPMPKWLAAQFK